MPESHAIGEHICENMILWPADVFDANPEDNLIYEMHGLGIHPDYRGRGLGRILVEEALKVGNATPTGLPVFIILYLKLFKTVWTLFLGSQKHRL